MTTKAALKARHAAREAADDVAESLKELLDARIALDAANETWLDGPEGAARYVEAGSAFQEAHAAWNTASRRQHDLSDAARAAAKAERADRAEPS